MRDLFSAIAVILATALPHHALAQVDPVTGTSTSALTADASRPFWTQTRLIPMCWHMLQFPTNAERDAAKVFVMTTIKEGWIDLIDLNITWTDCPTSGDAKHVRVLLRSGDPSENGTTLLPGTQTLSTAADRLRTPPNDPPGLLMGFRGSWNNSDADRTAFKSLILHEFGHVLGFGHEQDRPDQDPALSCYTGGFAGTALIGPPDSASIMGWSYCNEALGYLSVADIRGVREVYGPRPILNLQPTITGILTNYNLN
jgi:hypothetical protein